MKNTGTCPKCESHRIAIQRGNMWNRSYNYIYAGGLMPVYMTYYICTDCGLVENYVDNPKDLDKIRKKYYKPIDHSDFV
ncbi:MAG: hypothetical protein IPM42_12550 [Saprospiraceae bacterium]|nr:hypothetical protein [Saprospiraceae bacterium]